MSTRPSSTFCKVQPMWLLLANYFGAVKTVRYLFDNDVTVVQGLNLKDNFGKTPLTWAARNEHGETVLLLLQHGADINSRDTEGKTALACAIAQPGPCERAVIQLLIDFGAEINVVDDTGKTPLSLSCEFGHSEVAELLVYRGAKLESIDKNGRSPLWHAARRGETSIVKLLLQKGAHPGRKDTNGDTPLMAAVKANAPAIVCLLVGHGKLDEDDRLRALSFATEAIAHGEETGTLTKIIRLLDVNISETSRRPLYNASLPLSSRPLETDDDLRTEYSETSSLFDSRKTNLISLLVEDIIDNLLEDSTHGQELTDLVDENWVDKIAKILPHLLKSFALMIGHATQEKLNWEIMRFIHKHSREIAQSFRERYQTRQGVKSLLEFEDISEASETEYSIDFWPSEVARVNSWLDETVALASALPTEVKNGTIPTERPSVQAQEDMGEKKLTEDEDVTIRELLSETLAYRWLLGTLRRELLLCPADTDVMTDIRNAIMSILPTTYRLSRRAPSAGFAMVFELDWDPQAFIWREEYDSERGAALGMALTLTGSANDAQALSCGQYLAQTWPATGPEVLEVIKSVVRNGSANRELEHGTSIEATIDGAKLVVSARGTGRLLAELGEQLAWLGAALREGSVTEDYSVLSCKPSITHLVPSEDSPVPLEDGVIARWAFSFELLKESDFSSTDEDAGRCWFGLFRQPVVVRGYPIRSKPAHGTGLEIELSVAAQLAQAPGATVFHKRIIVKGFCAMLVLVEKLQNVLIWHLLTTEDESRISYLDPRISKLQAPEYNIGELGLLSGLETARHIVGWCRNVRNLTGEPEANYSIERSMLKSSFSGSFPGLLEDRLRDLSLYGQQLQLYNKRVLLAKRDKGKPHGGFDGRYDDRLKSISEKHLVLYDVGDISRAWLVDGASALLHTVRRSLNFDKKHKIYGKFYSFSFFEYDDKATNLGSRAASVLSYDKNKNQPLLRAGTESKETFRARVEQICSTLELILESQQLFNEGGYIPQDILEGFEFYDVAKNEPRGRIRTCIKPLPSQKSTWLHLTRKINAPVLFGKGFGDLIIPTNDKDGETCPGWCKVPTGMDYLTACVCNLKTVMEERGDDEGDNNDKTWRIVDNICWYDPDSAFDYWNSPADASSPRERDLAQVLVPDVILREAHILEPARPGQEMVRFNDLPDSGAVIFGYSKRYPMLENQCSDDFISLPGSSTHWGERSSRVRSLSRSGGLLSTSRSASVFDDDLPLESRDRYLEVAIPNTALSSRRPSSTYRQNPSPLPADGPHPAHPGPPSPSHSQAPSLPPPADMPVRKPISNMQPSLALKDFRVPFALCLLAIFVKDRDFCWVVFLTSTMVLFLYGTMCFKSGFFWRTSWGLRALLCITFSLLFVRWVLLTPVHLYTHTLLDLWTKYEDHPPHESSLTVYEPLSGTQIVADVFAIHGLGSNHESAWRHKGNETHPDVHWLVDILPKMKGYENTRITLLNHQTRWDSHAPQLHLKDYAEEMLSDIVRINQGKRPIIFIAHSFGGLLLKHVLITAKSDARSVARVTRGILFLGVPHFGSNTVFFASLLSCTAYCRGSRAAFLRFMSPESEGLRALDEQFSRLYVHFDRSLHSWPSPPHIVNFVEMRPEKFGTLSVGPTVNLKGGKLPYAPNVYLDTDHRGLNKFPSAEDPNFRKFFAHFSRLYPSVASFNREEA
ncbi:hypothetical protein QBC35DRAFT_476145 [Podospora australis]|uniref:GPI inositol-deacylase n=1 Tax=Podospora australis TaxID=1536484 RepID=A0AAN7AGD6_9PEZI|nr:hypothetical protein QBC35DRAFT_476145 [Podospora australis]